MTPGHGAGSRVAWAALAPFVLAACPSPEPSAAHAPSASAPAVASSSAPSPRPPCPGGGLAFGDLDDDVRLPRGSEVAQVTLEPAIQGRPLDAAGLRAMLDAAVRVSRCDPSVQMFHYGPWTSGSFTTSGGQRYTVQLFLGGRGVLTTPDGRRTMFDATLPPSSDAGR